MSGTRLAGAWGMQWALPLAEASDPGSEEQSGPAMGTPKEPESAAASASPLETALEVQSGAWCPELARKSTLDRASAPTWAAQLAAAWDEESASAWGAASVPPLGPETEPR